MFKLAVLVHKCLNGCAPAYLIDDCRLIRPTLIPSGLT